MSRENRRGTRIDAQVTPPLGRSRAKMSIKRDEPVLVVARLQKKVTLIRVTRAIEASVMALGYEKVRQEQFDVVLNFLKGNDVFVSLPTGGGEKLVLCLSTVCV